MSAPAIPAMSDTDLMSDLHNTLSEGISDSLGETAEGGEGEDSAFTSVDQPITGNEGDPVSDTELTAPEAAAPETQAEPDPNAPPYQLSADGKSYLLPKDEWAQQIAPVREYASKVQEILPTVQDAQNAHQIASDAMRQETDYLYGESGDMEAYLNHIAGGDHQDPQERAAYEQAFSRMMRDEAPKFLQSRAPEFHKAVAASFATPYIDSLYARAFETQQRAAQPGATEQDKAAANYELYAAQRAEYALTGKFRPDAKPKEQQPPNPEMQRIATERQALETQRQQMADQAWKSVDTQMVNGPAWGGVDSEIAKALEPAKGLYPEKAVEIMQKQIKADLIQKLQSDSEWAANHNMQAKRIESQYRAARNSGRDASFLKPTIEAYKANLLSRSRALLPSIVKPVLAEQTATAVKNNAQARQQGAARTQRVAPAQNPVSPQPKNGRMTRDELFASLARDANLAG